MAPETTIDDAKHKFESAIYSVGAQRRYSNDRRLSIECVYEIPNKGAILFYIAKPDAPRFILNAEGVEQLIVDAYASYLGFDETTNDFREMISTLESSFKQNKP